MQTLSFSRSSGFFAEVLHRAANKTIELKVYFATETRPRDLLYLDFPTVTFFLRMIPFFKKKKENRGKRIAFYRPIPENTSRFLLITAN